MSRLTLRLGGEVQTGKPATYHGEKQILVGRRGDTSYYGGFLPRAVLKQDKYDKQSNVWRVYLPDDTDHKGAIIYGARFGFGLRMEYAKAVAALIVRNSDATPDNPMGTYRIISAGIRSDPDGIALQGEIASLMAIVTA